MLIYMNPQNNPNNSDNFVTTNTPSSSPISNPVKPSKPKASNLKTLLMFLVLLIVVGASSTGAYFYGKGENDKKAEPTPAVATQPIVLPPEAIVTAECVVGRGKQYIIPKDIPQGPVYNVVNNKVIAIEFGLSVKALLTNSEEFSTTVLRLTKDYPVDHLSMVPVPPKAGDTDQYFHLIMFVVTKDEAKAITCGDDATSTGAPQTPRPTEDTTTR